MTAALTSPPGDALLSAQGIALKSWGEDEAVAYDGLAGRTHLLDALGQELLQQAQNAGPAGLTATVLCQRVLDAEEPLPDPAHATEQLHLAVASLLQAGLLRPLP